MLNVKLTNHRFEGLLKKDKIWSLPSLYSSTSIYSLNNDEKGNKDEINSSESCYNLFFKPESFNTLIHNTHLQIQKIIVYCIEI